MLDLELSWARSHALHQKLPGTHSFGFVIYLFNPSVEFQPISFLSMILQLVEANDSTESVLFQFGKLVQDVYILDFNPMYLSAVQAFAIGLSAFDRKLVL